MKIYNKEGMEANCDSEQLTIMLASGWSRTKQEEEPELEEKLPELEEEPEPEKELEEEPEKPQELKEKTETPVKVKKRIKLKKSKKE